MFDVTIEFYDAENARLKYSFLGFWFKAPSLSIQNIRVCELLLKAQLFQKVAILCFHITNLHLYRIYAYIHDLVRNCFAVFLFCISKPPKCLQKLHGVLARTQQNGKLFHL